MGSDLGNLQVWCSKLRQSSDAILVAIVDSTYLFLRSVEVIYDRWMHFFIQQKYSFISSSDSEWWKCGSMTDRRKWPHHPVHAVSMLWSFWQWHDHCEHIYDRCMHFLIWHKDCTFILLYYLRDRRVEWKLHANDGMAILFIQSHIQAHSGLSDTQMMT